MISPKTCLEMVGMKFDRKVNFRFERESWAREFVLAEINLGQEENLGQNVKSVKC